MIARNKNGYYLATYSDDQLANLFDEVEEVMIPIAQGERFERYLQYEFRKVSEEARNPTPQQKKYLFKLKQTEIKNYHKQERIVI